MKFFRTLGVGVSALALLLSASAAFAQSPSDDPIKHVLLISIDGMHSLDFANCSKGISTINDGAPYCPQLAALSNHGVHYLQALTPRPSDSFPGLTAIVTGATPRSAGMYYDVSYDRKLSPPYATTPYGIIGGPTLCPSVIGTQVGYDEEIDVDLTQINGGGGIDTDYLPRDATKNCSPVYPHSYLRVNTIFEVVKANGGYTAWTDKHPSYEWTNGPSGQGVDDFYGPEINSIPVALPQFPGCSPVPFPAPAPDDGWTTNLQNIQCYDSLHVQAVLNQIDGFTHDRSHKAPVPAVFGTNFQTVSVGEKLKVAGYTDVLGTPSAGLAGELDFIDQSLGKFVSELSKKNLL